MFPCIYSSGGRDRMLKPSQKSLHEVERCEFREFKCPFSCLDCKGDRNWIVKHLLSKKHSLFRETEEPWEDGITLSLGVDFTFSNKWTPSRNATWLLSKFGSDFIVSLFFFFNGHSNICYLTVQMISSISNSRRYEYSALLNGPYRELSYKGRCYSLHERPKYIYQMRDCLNVDGATAAKFVKTDKDGSKVMKLNVNIQES